MTKSRKLSATEQMESSIEAIRRHLCQILGFDLGILDLVQGDEFVTVAQVTANNQDKASDLLSQLVDENQEAISFANTQLAQEAKVTQKAVISQVRTNNKSENTNQYPYAIVPIGCIEEEQSPVLGLIRVIAYDENRKISKYDLSTLKLTGEHLANQLQKYGQMMGIETNNIQANKKAHILLAHSSRLIKRRFSRILSAFYEVHEADSVEKAEEILNENYIDLILLDKELPGVSPEEFCQNLKEAEKNIPVVLITPSTESKIEEQITCVDDYLIETCLDPELLTRVKSILRYYQLQKDLVLQSQLLDNYSQRLEEASVKLSSNEQLQLQNNKEFQFLKWESELLREQERLLHRISNEIRQSFNIEQNLQNILEGLQGWLNLDVCFITLPAPEEPEDEIRCECAVGEDYRVNEFDLDLISFEVFRKHFKADEALVVNQVESDPRIEPFKLEALARHQVLSVFYIPISYKNELLGLLCGFKCEAEAHWNQDNIAFLQSVADQIAVGVTNARLYARVQRQATTDGLTGLLNHRTGQEKLSEQLRLAERYQRNLAIMMIDVDHFKPINDNYGHPTGDAVLKSVARRIQKDCRDVDLAIRYGGEEFLLVLPEVNLDGAMVVAERIRKNLSQEEIFIEDGDLIKVTASLGIAAFPDNARSQQQLLDLADRALYVAKRNGRDQVRTAKDLNQETTAGTIESIASEPAAVESIAVESIAVESIAVESVEVESVEVESVAIEPVAVEPVAVTSAEEKVPETEPVMIVIPNENNQVNTADVKIDKFKETKVENIIPQNRNIEQSISNKETTEREELLPEVVEMVKALATALYSKSEYNKIHHLETARLSEMLGRIVGLPQKQIEQIRVAGLLHDVGTLSIPPDLINKVGIYNEEEREMIKQHPMLGAELLRPIKALKEICDILENHHERWDGTGYPNGLKGEEIPLAARIVSIVDSYHALISDRPYRPALTEEDAITTLQEGAGKQWDPFLVEIFISLLTKQKEEAKKALQAKVI